MDLNKALQEVNDDDQEDDDDVYAGRTLKSEDSTDKFKIRYARGQAESKTFARYASSLRNIIPVRSFKRRDGNYSTKVDESGLFSFITYSWIFSYLWAAFKGRVNENQTWNCSMYDSSTINSTRIEYLWKLELEQNPTKPSLFKVVWIFIKTRVIMASIVFFFCLIFGFIGPTCFVRGLISYAEQPPMMGEMPNFSLGLILVLSLLLVELARVLSYGATWAISYRTGIRLRGALLTFLYKKLINAKSLGKRTSSEIVNIYANDGQRLFDAVTFAPLVAIGPLVIIGGIIHLLFVIGPWSLLGILIFLVFDAFQFVLGKTMTRFRASAIKKTEKRINLMGEIIRCIRLIKMNAWEESFKNTIEEMRRNEKIDLRTAGYAQSLAIASGPVVPVVAAVFTFMGVILSDGDLLASEAFSAITVFFVMLFGIRMIPYGSRYCAEAYVALQRIKEIILMPEYEIAFPAPGDPSLAIDFHNATFTWRENDHQLMAAEASERSPVMGAFDENNSSNIALDNIDLKIKKKELIGVCGPVGSGKTALLNSLLGHMVMKNGSLKICGNIAYVAQTPWIQNLSVQANILFGLPMNTSRYYRVITACELSKDLETMKAGDQTEVGERGVTLSGGQKARIALARALFANRQIYLLDNILASLDTRVGDRVFRTCIKEMLGNKTVMMVSNDPKRLSNCDRVVFMDSKRIVGFETHENLLNECEAYALFCNQISSAEKKKIDLMDATEEEKTQKEMLMALGASKLQAASSFSDLQASNPNSSLDIPIDGHLVENEENFGFTVVRWPIYKKYIRAAGGYLIWTILLLAFVINVASSIFSTAWLSHWLKNGHTSRLVNANSEIVFETTSLAESDSLSFFVSIYALSLLFLFASGFLKALIFVKVSLNAASHLHSQMVNSIIKATVQFFDTTPSGRILNRFSKDMDEIDVKLPFTTEVFLQNAFICLGYLIMIAWVFPVFLIACIPLSIIFGLFVFCFRAGITCLKRSENISRSPLFDHITSSMDGLQTIHALGQTEHFIETLKTNLDFNSSAIFMYQSAVRWLAVWLDLLVVFVTFVVSLLIVLLTGSVEPADAGMALAFAIQMSGIFQFAVRAQAELEGKMTSVERVSYYCDHVESEGEWEAKNKTSVPADWPHNGLIEFKDVKLRYRLNLPLALDGITLRIEPKEKIGIIGRTGSGKSSLCNVLYRMYPLTWGSILIDGINIAHIGLHRLRRGMAIIPQDPALFAGTLRFNLDPTNEFNDDQLWNALEKTCLKDMVSSLEHKLDFNITEGGRNLSVGEKQLICMARAILRRVRIVILDEATANLDSVTDHLVQKCLHEAFSECTVLLIAHRLENVLGMEKILFMEQGKVLISKLAA